jgi:hypothetical protein
MRESANIFKSTLGQPTRNGTQDLLLQRKRFTNCYTAPRKLNLFSSEKCPVLGL